MSRDLLNDINEGALTADAAEALLSDALDTDVQPDIHFRFSPQEWTAFGHGAALAAIAAWRKSGWPTHCARCSQPLAAAEFGWRAVENDGHWRLQHLRCP